MPTGASPASETASDVDERGWIVVQVVQPNRGGPVSGLAYVLPAGSPGVEDEDLIPHGYPAEDAPLRLQVDRPGLYDVGFTWRGRTLMQEAVRVAAGKSVLVHFEPRAGEPVALRLASPLPVHERGVVRAHVLLSRESSLLRRFVPGRGEDRQHDWVASWTSGVLRIGDLLPEETATLTVGLYVKLGGPTNREEPLGTHVALCRPRFVRGGEEVTVECVPAARLEVEVALAPDDWPEGVARSLRVTLESGGGTQIRYVPVRAPERAHKGVFGPLVFYALAGPGRIRWEGEDVVPGSQEITLAAEETTRLRIAPAFGGPSSLRRPLRVEVELPEVVKRDDFDYEVVIGGIVRGDEGGLDGRTWTFEGVQEGRQDFYGRIRTAKRLMAAAGPGWASAPADVPERGGIRLTLQPAGQLVVVLEVEPAEGASAFGLRRKDGLPIYSVDDGTFHNVMWVQTGSRLGALRPGEVVFEMWRGVSAVGEVRATVRAGHSTPLVIR